MSKRTRAAGFTAAAAVCAALAAASAGGGGDDATALGSLRDVVVATKALPARQALDRKRVEASLEIRRIPASATAPDALSNPAEALGRRPAAPIPAGSYLVASQLLEARRSPGSAPEAELGGGRHPVEISVSAAGPLASAISDSVDVVVTSEPTTGAGGGRTYVAARSVELLGLSPAADDPAAAAAADPAATSAAVATLALTRGQALRLIHAQSFAREVRLIAH